jgi:hypothetical protein
MKRANARWLSLALLAVILGAGVAIGVAVDRLWLWPGPLEEAPDEPEHRPRDRAGDRSSQKRAKRAERLVQRFRRELELDARQTAAVRQAVQRLFADIGRIKRESRARVKKTREQVRADIRRVLTPAQRERYQQMVTAYEKRRRERRERRERRRRRHRERSERRREHRPDR